MPPIQGLTLTMFAHSVWRDGLNPWIVIFKVVEIISRAKEPVMARFNEDVKVTVDFASLRLAAANSMGLFLDFAREFNTYEVRSEQGKPSDKAATKAVDAIRNLEAATGERIILIPVKDTSDKEAVLDCIYEMTIRATRFA